MDTHQPVPTRHKAYAARNHCITVNKEEEFAEWQKATGASTMTAEFKADVRYFVWQYEIAPGTNRRHIQAYVETKKVMGFAGLKKLFNCPSMHIEGRKGTPEQAANYCKKAESRDPAAEGFHEWGTLSRAKQGARTDLANAVEVMKAGGVKAVALEMPTVYIRNHRGLHQLEYVLAQHENSTKKRDVTSLVFFGSPGTGKTFLAHELCNKYNLSYYVLHPPSSKNQSVWFNGYQDQKVLIIDEMNGTWIAWQFLLQLLDNYPLQVQTKGGQVWAGWTLVILTSNAYWESWFQYYDGGMDKSALRRRLKHVYKFFGNEKDGYKQLEITETAADKLPDEFPADGQEADIKQHFMLRQARFITPRLHEHANSASTEAASVDLLEEDDPPLVKNTKKKPSTPPASPDIINDDEPVDVDAILAKLDEDWDLTYKPTITVDVASDDDDDFVVGEYGKKGEESPEGSQAEEGEESEKADDEPSGDDCSGDDCTSTASQ